MNLRLPAGYVEGKAAQAQAEARESFWAFRKNLRYGTMMLGAGGLSWSPSNCNSFTKILWLGAGPGWR
jgi:hypothetical protein